MRLFVLFCAEWFRRDSRSTFLVWNDIAPEILQAVPWAAKAELTEHGLRYWERHLRRSTVREFLLTLALEGGFPVQILAEGGRSWLRDYLSQAMRRALGIPDPQFDLVHLIAGEEAGLLKSGYRDETFIELCAELVARLTKWRRIAEGEAGGIDPILFLDQRHPEWRNEIPIHLPDGDLVARDLLNGLVRERPARFGASGDISATRLLVRIGGAWRPALRISADGEIGRGSLKQFTPADGRLRAHPVGRLAEHLTGVMARLEPPAEGGETWRVAPLLRLDQPLVGFPFEAEAAVDIGPVGFPPKRMIWPRGEPVRSELLVFAADGEADTIRLVGTGSTRSRHPTLFVMAPEHWSVQPVEPALADADAACAEEISAPQPESVPSLACRLHEVSRPSWFIDSDDSEAYLVCPGSDPDTRRLSVRGDRPWNLSAVDPRLDILRGAIQAEIIEDGVPRKIRANQVFWKGGRGPIRDFSTTPIAPGLIDLLWREPGPEGKSIQQDRIRLAVLPRDLEVSGRMVSATRASVQVTGLADWRLEVRPDPDQIIERVGEELQVTFTGAPFHRLRLRLTPPLNSSIDMVLKLQGKDAVFIGPDAKVLAAGQHVARADLRGMTFVAPSPTDLCVSLKARNAPKSAHLRVRVDGEQPLGPLRSVVDEFLALTDDLDAVVELEPAGQPGLPLRCRRFSAPELAGGAGFARTASNIKDEQAVARMVGDPMREYLLPRIPAASGSSFGFPDALKGVCLAYLRRGPDVVSRPVVLSTVHDAAPAAPGSFRAAAQIQDASARRAAIRAALDHLATSGDDRSARERAWLTETICGLNGLPASALDCLRELASAPAALATLLMFAPTADARGPVFALEQQLPFLWLGLPVEAWAVASRAKFEAVVTALEVALPGANVHGLALDDSRAAWEAIANLEPALRTALVCAGAPARPDVSATAHATLLDLASAHVKRSAERDLASARDAERHWRRLHECDLTIPAELERFDLRSHGALLAPCLVAASAAGRLQLRADDLVAVRRAMRDDPDYLARAYSLILPIYFRAGSCNHLKRLS